MSIYGGGGWGCALACQIAKIQNEVQIFLRNEQILQEIDNYHTNKKYLTDVTLPVNIRPTTNILDIINSEIIVIAVPSYAFGKCLYNLKLHGLRSETILLIATKGVAKDPARLLSEELESILPHRYAFISGPNFAKEVAMGLTTSITIAAIDLSLAARISDIMKSCDFITSITADIITIQISGTIKNIIAIRSGMYKALQLGENARACLINEGLREIMNLSVAMGGKIETLLEVGVLGDLMLTCYSETSRNTKFGYELAISKNTLKFLENYPYLVEGRESIRLVLQLAEKYDIELPVIAEMAMFLK
ncbi:MAG: NAD(P)H-dependent glycerol-3-phosphate dehydrogenase [Rickettsiaceae bacterium]|nr:MAG: NAD(P)H-dependent glycerol-3-phosphate dehydrogenase [Rickettsiaceae bacterium]